ncbi:MAG: winged helix-turn-helix transcriptional regulator [Actinobacteria bacterium]|nr:winged helix-turn-helix transcriptional regulator [Actinomycetota bacterium]
MFATPDPSRSSGARRGGSASDSAGHSGSRAGNASDRAAAARPATRDDPWLSDREQQAWRSFLELTGTLTEHLDRELRHDAGIPHTYYQVLAMLSEAPDRALRMSDLAAAAWASPSRMSHAVDRLQEAGWVERRPAPGDGRGQIAVLTEAGHRKLTEAAPDHARTVRAILFDPLGPELLDAFAEVCRRALQQLADREAACGVATE